MKKKKILKKREKISSVFRVTELRSLLLITMSIAVVVIGINFIFFSRIPQLFAVINLFAGLIAVGIPVFLTYTRRERAKRIEEMFPVFLRDVNENIRVGMTLPQAIRTATENDYGLFSEFVKEMSAKIDWGISIDRVLKGFSEKVPSPVIRRTVASIIETHESGGNIGDVLASVSESVQSIEKIKRERSTRIYSQMVNGYFIFFVFLGVMLGM